MNPEFQNPKYKRPNSTHLPFRSVISKEIVKKDEKQKQLERCLQIQSHRQDLENKKQEHQLRQDYANWAKRVAKGWLLFVAVIIIAYCVINLFYGVKIIPQWVFVTLLASTTVTIFSLNNVIVKGLFINSKKSKGNLH